MSTKKRLILLFEALNASLREYFPFLFTFFGCEFTNSTIKSHIAINIIALKAQLCYNENNNFLLNAYARLKLLTKNTFAR